MLSPFRRQSLIYRQFGDRIEFYRPVGTKLKRNNKMKASYPIKTNQEVINSGNCVKLLGGEIDNKFSLEKHISALVNKQVTS